MAKSRFHFFPNWSLSIHVWGGLGSQLYAWALAEILSRKYMRKIILVLHTGGVTPRYSDISFVRERFEMQFVDDFSTKHSTTLNRKSRLDHRRILLILLRKIRILLTDEDLNKGLRIFPWTRFLRGHYTEISIPTEVIKQIIDTAYKAGKLSPVDSIPYETLIHYRLGDLLELSMKKPTSVERFKIFRSYPKIAVASDSCIAAAELLSDALQTRIQPLETSSPWESLALIINSQYFVGTASKISFWGIAFRKTLNVESVSFMTKEHKGHLVSLLSESTYQTIQTY